MARCSNAVFASFNVLTLLLGAAVLAGGIYLGAPHRGSGAATDCERFLRTPALVLGAALLVVSMAGIAGACCRASLLLWLYLFLAALLILIAVCFTVFALVVTNAGAGRAVSGRGFREYRLGDYSSWLRRRVEDDRNWGRIRSCLAGAGVCRSLQKNRTSDEFVNDSLSPVQDDLATSPNTLSKSNNLESMPTLRPPRRTPPHRLDALRLCLYALMLGALRFPGKPPPQLFRRSDSTHPASHRRDIRRPASILRAFSMSCCLLSRRLGTPLLRVLRELPPCHLGASLSRVHASFRCAARCSASACMLIERSFRARGEDS